MLNQQQIRIIYLDELDDIPSSSIGLGVIKLVVATEDKAVQQAKNLINQVQQTDEASRSNLLELVERMLIYKFVNKTQQELEAMFGLTDWRQTKFYQEVKEETKQEVKEEVREETKLETIPRLLKFGLSIEQIAQALELNVEQVQQAIDKRGEERTGSNS
ncbi:DUF2887 domain-containing protein [Nostoc sp. UIC 10607]|uniref:DUF2887 domain-containing protein n=1 Tax=Nostoc sp. UIC 10607 TaxID=3045935 RepID=UPI00399FF5E9